MRIRWTSAATDDLQKIGEYLKEHNPSFARSIIQRLYDSAQSLKTFPYRGRIGREAGTRELVVSPLPYVIVYEVSEVVHIARVLHGAQDWPGSQKKR